MTTPNLPSVEYLKECFDYNPATGELTWKERPRYHFKSESSMKSVNNRNSGHTAGSYQLQSRLDYANIYGAVGIMGRKYYLHNVVAALILGHWPECGTRVVHRNRNTKDNRADNLTIIHSQ